MNFRKIIIIDLIIDMLTNNFYKIRYQDQRINYSIKILFCYIWDLEQGLDMFQLNNY